MAWHDPAHSPRFLGEIISQDDLRTNIKGGSVTATLKQMLLRAVGIDPASLGTGGDTKHLSAAAVAIDSNTNLLLMAPGDSSRLRVSRTSKNSIEITVVDEDDEGMDAIAGAFVAFKKRLFEEGKLNLSTPMTADEFENMTDEALNENVTNHQNA